MKTKGAKPAGKDARKMAQARRALKSIDLAATRKEITQLVAGEAFGMILSTIEQVHQGRHAAMKMLFQMIGLYPVPRKAEDAEENGLAKVLLDRLGLPREVAPQAGYERLPEEAMSKSSNAVE